MSRHAAPSSPARPPAVPIRGMALDVLGEWSGEERFAADLMDHLQRDNGLSLPDAAFLRDI
ncbi:MAG: hypothetical protein Q8M07_01220, partial [Prosthecobacter sp.]|nr:hypothetical protein [Prosthecobacter sp.]